MKFSSQKFDIHKNYPLIFEIGLIGALLLFIAAFKFHIPEISGSSNHNLINDEPPIVLAPITVPEKKPPKPIAAAIPAEIPNDDPIDTPPIDFGDFDDVSTTLPLPPEKEAPEENEILDHVEFMPKMKGGIQALYDDITYPESAKRIGIEGMVVVQFIVNEKGKVENPEIIRGIGSRCDEEVLKAIKKQTYSPGVQNGNLVKVRMKVTVHFRLEK